MFLNILKDDELVCGLIVKIVLFFNRAGQGEK